MPEDRSWLADLADLLGTAGQSGIESPVEPLTTTMRGLAANNPFSGVASAFYGDDPRDVARPRLGKPKLDIPAEGEPHVPEREGAVENREKARAALPEPANAGVLPAGGTYRDPALQDAPLDTSSLDWSWGRGVALGEDGRPLRNSKVFDRASGNVTEDRSSIGGGGFAPSTQDWSRVANPEMFEAYREQPARKLHEMLAADPLAVEKGKSLIDVEHDLGIERGKAAIEEAAKVRRQAMISRAYAEIAQRKALAVKQLLEQPGWSKLSPEEQRIRQEQVLEPLTRQEYVLKMSLGVSDDVRANSYYAGNSGLGFAPGG